MSSTEHWFKNIVGCFFWGGGLPWEMRPPELNCLDSVVLKELCTENTLDPNKAPWTASCQLNFVLNPIEPKPRLDLSSWGNHIFCNPEATLIRLQVIWADVVADVMKQHQLITSRHQGRTGAILLTSAIKLPTLHKRGSYYKLLVRIAQAKGRTCDLLVFIYFICAPPEHIYLLQLVNEVELKLNICIDFWLILFFKAFSGRLYFFAILNWCFLEIC